MGGKSLPLGKVTKKIKCKKKSEKRTHTRGSELFKKTGGGVKGSQGELMLA